MRIMLVTDAWKPQMNGVVRTLARVVQECRALGHEVEMITPGDGYRTLPLPTYPDIRLALFAKRSVARRMKAFEPEAIHIATEGPLGMAARSICLKLNMPFTTSYHTKFPEYITERFPFIPLSLGYAFMRWFHNAGGRLMVTTPSMRKYLEERGFRNIIPWARGVDTDLFHPEKRSGQENGVYKNMKRPVYLNVGRIAVEKNLPAFLDLDLEGTKVVVGDGPSFKKLQADYPDTVFAGAHFGEELARYFAEADVFVFPSLTDTFGLVILEAMACGTPVAAFPSHGPKDIIPGSHAGCVDHDLKKAIEQARTMNRETVRSYAEGFSWKACAEEFTSSLECPPPPERKRIWQRLTKLIGRHKD